MTQFEYDFLTKAQVDGIKELIDLCRNGYQVVFGATLCTGRRYKLRHYRNGRTLMVNIFRYSYSVEEGKKILKMVVYDENGRVMQHEN